MDPIHKVRSILIFTVIYYLAAKLGLSLAFLNASATAVWPATGLALAVMLLKGSWIWPGLFLGALLVNMTITPGMAAVGIATGNTLEAVLGVWLIRRFANGVHVFDRPDDILKYVVLAGLLSTSVSATVGVSSLTLAGYSPVNVFLPVWVTWWLGDMVSALIVAPLLLVWFSKPWPRFKSLSMVEIGFVWVFLLLCGLFVFCRFSSSVTHPFVYLTILPLLWAALRFGKHGAILAACVMNVLAIWGTLNGFGPFVVEHPNQSLLFLQTFLATATLTVLIIAAFKSEMQKLTDDLKRSNTELEQFAYVASHDLREPLRIIASFLQLLDQRYAQTFDKNAAEYVRFAREGALRAQQLVDDLLNFSRIMTKRQPNPSKVDMNSIFKTATDNLKLLIEENEAKVTHDRLPTLTVNTHQMIQIFQNLIGNAIRFRKKGLPPRIHVKAELKGREWIFSVEDNGIGIAKEHFERIFIVFQRLHSHSEYPGSGIGLAICKRIIEMQGGRIWVQSDLGIGSVFYFTIPT